MARATLALAIPVLVACTPAGSGRAPGPSGTPMAPAASTVGGPSASVAPASSPTAQGSGAPAAPSAAPSAPSVSAPTAGPASVSLAKVAGGFTSPLFATGDGSGSGRLYVVEQGGTIRVVAADGTVLQTPFLDISSGVSAGGERGLLGLAFHPSYASNGLFYVDYTDRDGNTVVAEMRRAADAPDRSDPGSERVLLRVDQPYPNHNGGMLAFGPDGYLYVGLGDGGSGGDPQNRAQDLGTLLGKILRIDVDARDPGLEYAIPSSNPFVGTTGARPEIWLSGVRNPWRFSFDARTGDLWVGDVGQSAWEEVDRLTAASGGGAGANLGWRLMEGHACYDPPTGCGTDGLTLPVAVYDHDAGCAITGGYVDRGERSPAIDGTYLFSDSCSGRIWGLDAAGPDEQQPVLLAETGRPIVSFAQGDDGTLFVVDIADGSVLRVDATRG